MSTFPTHPRAALLSWSQSHAPKWVTNADAIGLTAAQATEFSTAVAAYAAAALAAESADEAKKAAVAQARIAFNALRGLAGERVKTIRAYAESSPDPATVYNLAQIPEPAPPSPIAPPGQPTDFRVSLEPDGSVMLKWKCANPVGASGTVYHVRRRETGSGPFTPLGTVGLRSFTDSTIPPGTSSVDYIVQAQRSATVGAASLAFTVRFGTSGGAITITESFSKAA